MSGSLFAPPQSFAEFLGRNRPPSGRATAGVRQDTSLQQALGNHSAVQMQASGHRARWESSGTQGSAVAVDRSCCSRKESKCDACADEEEEATKRYEGDPQGVSGSRPSAAEPAQSAQAGPPAAETGPAPKTDTVQRASHGLLAEDDAKSVGPGRMRKSAFLAQLRASICAAAESALAGTGRSTADCPYLDYWFQYYGRQPTGHVTHAIARYAPESVGAETAQALIEVLTARARRAVEIWVSTGKVTGVPETTPTEGARGIPPQPDEPAGAIRFKDREGGARNSDDPQQVRRMLGRGEPLDGGMRSRMESAFGANFSAVRVHTDAGASAVAQNLNAHAFAVGEHIAFGEGEYRPGTPVGDAMIAHELAHVLQQERAPAAPRSHAYNLLEEDADCSAAGVVASLWGSARRGLTEIRRNALPTLQSGLRLQRCPKSQGPAVRAPSSDVSKQVNVCGAGFTLQVQRATGNDHSVNVEVKQDHAGQYFLQFRGIREAHAVYDPNILIQAGSDAKAQDYEVGLIQNLISEDLQYSFTAGGPIRTALPTPMKDGAPQDSGVYDEVFVEKPARGSEATVPYQADGDSATLSLTDIPSDGAYINLQDNSWCQASAGSGTMTEAVFQDHFRTWVGVRNKRTSCVATFHHIDWDVNWAATVSGSASPPTAVATAAALHVTQPNGDGSPPFFKGGQVPADYDKNKTGKKCGL